MNCIVVKKGGGRRGELVSKDLIDKLGHGDKWISVERAYATD